MTKEDLKYGNVVELRNGDLCIYNYTRTKDVFVCINNDGYYETDDYKDDLTFNFDCEEDKQYDIVKVYKDYTLKELLWERKEIKLTNVERIILENIRKEYKWIARNKEGYLFAYDEKPIKEKYSWNYKYNIYDFPFDNLFQFIQWDDDEPYSIEELLKENN